MHQSYGRVIFIIHSAHQSEGMGMASYFTEAKDEIPRIQATCSASYHSRFRSQDMRSSLCPNKTAAHRASPGILSERNRALELGSHSYNQPWPWGKDKSTDKALGDSSSFPMVSKVLTA